MKAFIDCLFYQYFGICNVLSRWFLLDQKRSDFDALQRKFPNHWKHTQVTECLQVMVRNTEIMLLGDPLQCALDLKVSV